MGNQTMLLRKSDLLRRTVLLLAILISGGWLLFPRVPFLALIAFLWLMARGWSLSLKREMLPVIALLAAILILTLVRPEGVHVESLMIRFANFLAALLLLDMYLRAPQDALHRDLCFILGLMAVQALLTVLLAQSVGFIFVPVTVAETTYNTFLLLFNYHTMLEDGSGWARPDGFFYEPGVFQIYLNLYLYLALFVFRSWRQSLLAILAVLSTQSTTGVLNCFLILSVYAATQYVNRGSALERIAKTMAAAVLLFPVVFLAWGNIVEKTTGEARGSFWARQYDLLTGVNVIAENPVLGIGFDYEQYHQAANRLGYADTVLEERITMDRGNTNGIVFLLYSIGIPLSIPFLIGIFRQKFFRHRLLIGTVLCLTFIGESMIFTPFFLMIVFSGLLFRPAGSPLRAAQNAA